MNRLVFLLAATALAGGCSAEPKPLGPATTPDAARVALAAAFDAWKQGKTRDDLARQSPPVYLLDDDFARGRKLTDYRVEGDPTPVGTGLTYVVHLSFADGQPPTRRLAYRVVTDPTISISREDRLP
jgi:hypothetical protein